MSRSTRGLLKPQPSYRDRTIIHLSIKDSHKRIDRCGSEPGVGPSRCLVWLVRRFVDQRHDGVPHRDSALVHIAVRKADHLRVA
jgi:hypothetical protein